MAGLERCVVVADEWEYERMWEENGVAWWWGGDEYLGLHPIGNATVALMLASAEGKLFMHGGKEKNWFGIPGE